MSEISLMPSSYKGYVEKKKRLNKLTLVSIMVVFVLFLSYILMSILYTAYDSQLLSLETEKKNIENRVGSLSSYEENFHSISQYESLIKETAMAIPPLEDVIIGVSESLPYGAWFDSIKLDYVNNTGKGEITGITTNKQIITTWLKNIEEDPLIKTVELKYMVDTVENEEDVIRFSISLETSSTVKDK